MQSLGKENQLPGPGRNFYRMGINTLCLGGTNSLFCVHQLLTCMMCGGSWPLQELTNHPTGQGYCQPTGTSSPCSQWQSAWPTNVKASLTSSVFFCLFFYAFGVHAVLLCWGKASTNAHLRPTFSPVYVGNRITANRPKGGFVVLFWDRVSLCSFGWPGAFYVDQADLELKKCLPLPLECWE